MEKEVLKLRGRERELLGVGDEELMMEMRENVLKLLGIESC